MSGNGHPMMRSRPRPARVTAADLDDDGRERRTAAAVRAQLEALGAEGDAAHLRLAELEAGRTEVLLQGTDEDCERHDAEIRKIRRIIERAGLRMPGLRAELAEAEQREEAERRARQRAEAEAAVTALLARVRAEYEEPARRIAAFLADWKRVYALAEAAGVQDLMCPVVEVEPAYVAQRRTEAYTCFIDEQGNETQEKYPVGPDGRRANSFGEYPDGRKATPREQVTRTRTVLLRSNDCDRPAVTARVPSLPSRVVLPGASHGDQPFWPAKGDA